MSYCRRAGSWPTPNFPRRLGPDNRDRLKGSRSMQGVTVSSWSRWNQLNVTRSPALSWPGVQRRSTQDGSNQPFGYFPGPAHSSLSRMLKKEAGWLGRSPCSRNARPQKTLVGRAHLGSSHPPLCDSFDVALLGTRRVLARQGWAGETSGLFEHPARSCPVAPDTQTIGFPPDWHCFSAAY